MDPPQPINAASATHKRLLDQRLHLANLLPQGRAAANMLVLVTDERPPTQLGLVGEVVLREHGGVENGTARDLGTSARDCRRGDLDAGAIATAVRARRVLGHPLLERLVTGLPELRTA